MSQMLPMLGPPMGPPDAAGPGLPPPPGPGAGGSPTDLIRQILQLIDAYRSVETDDEDLAVATRMSAAFQQLLAKQQRDLDQASGIGPAHRVLRRTA